MTFYIYTFLVFFSQISNKNFKKRARNFFRKLKIFLDILIKLKILRHKVFSVLKNIEKQKSFIYIHLMKHICGQFL